jgi:hypothetical protein
MRRYQAVLIAYNAQQYCITVFCLESDEMLFVDIFPANTLNFVDLLHYQYNRINKMHYLLSVYYD